MNVPLRGDLVTELRAYLADKLAVLQAKVKQAGEPVPMRLPPKTPLLHVPRDFVRIFDRDLAEAGIPKRDDRDRTADIHAPVRGLEGLRHTFGLP